MSIASVGSTPIPTPPPTAPAPKSNDHDADDGGASPTPALSASAPPAPGVYTISAELRDAATGRTVRTPPAQFCVAGP